MRAVIVTGCVALALACSPGKSEPDECDVAGGAPHWRRLVAPEHLRPGGVGGAAPATAFWSDGLLWIWGTGEGATWDLSTGEWRPIVDFPGSADSPLVGVVHGQLVVFGGLASSDQVNNDHPLTETTGWQFDLDAGWRQIAMAPGTLVYSRRSFVSQDYFYVFSDAGSPPDAAIFDPSADKWTTTTPPVSLQLPGTRTSCTTSSGLFSGYGPIGYFDEHSFQWSDSDAEGVDTTACTGEEVFGRSPAGNFRFSFEKNDWVATAPDGFGGARLYPAGAHIAAAPTDSNADLG